MTVHNADTAQKIMDMVGIVGSPGSVTAGDAVSIAAGAYDLTPNVLAGNNGVTVYGESAAGCEIKGIQTHDLSGSANAVTLEDFTADLTGLAGSFRVRDGTFYCNRLEIKGPNTGDLVSVYSYDSPAKTYWRDCVIHDAGSDVFDASGVNAHGPASETKLYNCQIYGVGPGGGDQVVTFHNGHRGWVLGGSIHTQRDAAIAAMNGLGADSIVTSSYMHDVTINGEVADGVSCYDSRLAPYGTTNPTVSANYGTVEYERCDIDCSTGYTRPVDIRANAVLAFTACLFRGNASGAIIVPVLAASGSLALLNCRLTGMAKGIDFQTSAAFTASIRNTIFDNCTWYIENSLQGGSVNFTNSGHNVFGGTQSGSLYTLQTGDVTAAAEIDALGIPTKDGNCDYGNGDPSLRPGVGYLDMLGRHKLDAYKEYRGPISPQYDRVGNTLHPVSRSAGEMT